MPIYVGAVFIPADSLPATMHAAAARFARQFLALCRLVLVNWATPSVAGLIP